MKILTFFLFYILIVPSLWSQEQSFRWEEEKKMGDDDYYVVSAKENGLVLFRETDDYERGNKIWEFKFLDIKLNVVQEFEKQIDNDHALIGYEFENGFFYLLFQAGNGINSDWKLHKFNINDTSMETFDIPNEIEIELSHFLITDGNLVLGGIVVNKAAVVHYSLLDQKVTVLPGFYKKETVLVDAQKNQNGTFNVLFFDKEPKTGNDQLWLKVYSAKGALLLESTSTFEKDLRVHSGTTNKLEGSDLIISGSYGNKKSKLSLGFYFIKVTPGKNNQISYTDLTQLNNFFKYLGEDRERRIKGKIRESNRDKPFEYKTTLVVWKLVEKSNKYALFAEVIDPQYQTQPIRRRYNPYGQTHNAYDASEVYSDSRYYTSAHSLLNKDQMVAVKYRETIMLVFDRSGRLLQDESHTIKDLETPYLDQSTAYDYQEDAFQMIYKDKDELVWSNGTKEGNTVSDSVVSISTLNPSKVIKYEESNSGKVEHWYESNYFVWGHHRLQNLGANERKNVFYINKITIH